MSTERSQDHPTERRARPRSRADRLTVVLRPRGRLGTIEAQALDFNRHGMAVHTAMPLAKDRIVYLSLEHPEMRLDHLVGVVHNCVRQGARFRSGILFRTGSALQQDRALVKEQLARLEAALAQDAG